LFNARTIYTLVMELTGLLLDNEIKIVNGKIVIPEYVKRIKIDVGLSSSASNALTWLVGDPNLFVIGVEPIASSVKELNDKIRALPNAKAVFERFAILPIALAAKRGIRELHITQESSDSSSLLVPKHLPVLRKELVYCYTLGDVLEIVPWGGVLSRVDHLKIDCQGLDFEIIRSAEKQIQRVAIITAEADGNSYLGEKNDAFSMEGYLARFGFIFYNRRSFLRVVVGEFLHSFKAFRKLRIRLPSATSSKIQRDAKRSIVVDDPTFVNTSFLEQVNRGEITAYQKG